MLVACLTLIGCASHRKANDQLSFEAYQHALDAVATTPVALPERTPYDSDPAGKERYLASYREGYRTGLTGYYITPQFDGGPYHRERVAGYYSGLSAGWQLWSQNNLGPGMHFYGERPTKTN
jgi:hypothetical protein